VDTPTLFCLLLRNDSAKRHILGCGKAGGAYDLHIQTRARTAKFHHPMFNRSEVIMLTNKQTDAAENIHLASLFYASE